MPFDILEFLRSLVTLTTADYLRSVWGDQFWVEPLIDLMGILIVSTFCLLIVLVLIWLERKVVARIQDRVGPNRVGGRYGLLQTVADALKLLTKEDITPAGADKLAFNLAPILTVIAALLLWAVVPFGPGVIGTDLNIGLFYILAISSASVVPILLAGWGSNNKYALLGAFRSVAQLVSYEVPMILALIVPVLLARTLSMQEMIVAQNVWFIVLAPIAAIVFFICALAELGRTPFDLLEAESEIVAGFHTEYSGMKFAMFFLAEFINTLFMSALFATVFLGGWRGFGVEAFPILGIFYFGLKTFLVYFVIIWVRGTLPRVRIDHLLSFNWKFLVPLTVALLLVVAIVDKLMPAAVDPYTRAGTHLISNLILGFVALELLRRFARQRREGEEGTDTRPPAPVSVQETHAASPAAH